MALSVMHRGITTAITIVDITETKPKTFSKGLRTRLNASENALAYIVLASLLLFAPLAFGSVQLWAQGVLSLHVMVLFGVILWKKTDQMVLPPRWFSLLWLGFACLGVLSAIYSPYPAESLRQSFNLVLGFILMVSVLTLFPHHEEILKIIYAMIILGIIFCALAYLRNGLGILASDRPGLVGPYINHNHFSGLLEIVTPVALSCVIFGLRKEKYFLRVSLFTLAVLILSATMLLTRSRAGIASALAAILLVGFVNVFNQKRRDLFFYYFGTALFLVLLFVSLSWRLIAELSYSVLDEYFRFLIWESTFNMIAAKPFWGHGLGSYAWVSYEFRIPEVRHFLNYAHNEYLQVFAELGVMGFIPFILLLLSVPWVILRKCQHRHRTMTLAVGVGAATAAISLAFHAFYDFNYHIHANMIYLLVLIACAFGILEQKTEWKIPKPVTLWILIALFSCGSALTVAADLLDWQGQRLQKLKRGNNISMMRGATLLNPFVAEYHTNLAGVYWSTGQFDLAKNQFERALQLNSRLPNNLYHLALLAQRRQDPAEAQRLFEQAIRLDPQEPKKALAYAQFWVANQNSDMSMLACRDLVQHLPDFFLDCLQVLAPLQLSTGQLQTLLVNQPIVHRVYGNYLIEQHAWGQLDEWARDLVRHADPLPEHFFFLARAAVAKGYFKEAVFYCEEGLRRFPHEKKLTELLGQMYLQDGQVGSAVRLYRTESELEGDDVQWLIKARDVFYEHDQAEEAFALLLEAKQKRPNSVRIQELLVEHAQRNKDWLGAIRGLKELIAKGYDRPEYHFTLAEIYVRNDLYQDAISHWEAILRNQPRQVDALFSLADLYLKIGIESRAREYYEKILQYNPQETRAMQKLAELRKAK